MLNHHANGYNLYTMLLFLPVTDKGNVQIGDDNINTLKSYTLEKSSCSLL